MKGFLGAALLLLAVTPAAADDGIGLGLGIMAGACSTDSEIAPAERGAIESAGLTLVQTMLSDHPEAAFDQVDAQAQATTSREAFAASVAERMAQAAPYGPPRIARTYFVKNVSASVGTTPSARALCGPMADDGWVSVALPPGEDTAYVLIDTGSRNNGWTFTVNLNRDGTAWRAHNMHFDMSSVIDLDSAKLLDMGRREREAGHAFNAYMLVTGAASIAQRGPDFQLGIMQPIRTEFDKLAVPPELNGKAPFHWTLNGKTFDLNTAAVIGIGKELGLQFDLPQNDWPSYDAVDARNHAFIDAFRAANPDYARVFSFVVARAMKPDNSGGFATVYDNKLGYLKAPASPAASHP